MSGALNSVAWVFVPLALSFATLHAVFRRRLTLGLSAVCIFAAILFSLQMMAASKRDEQRRLQVALAAGATPAQLRPLERTPSHSPRIRFDLALLGASLLPLFIGEFRRMRRKGPSPSAPSITGGNGS